MKNPRSQKEEFLDIPEKIRKKEIRFSKKEDIQDITLSDLIDRTKRAKKDE